MIQEDLDQIPEEKGDLVETEEILYVLERKEKSKLVETI